MNPKVSPFCKNRAKLLEAISGGGRHGWDEPFVGRGKLATDKILTLVWIVPNGSGNFTTYLSLYSSNYRTIEIYFLPTFSEL
jgi:hypothetical protein